MNLYQYTEKGPRADNQDSYGFKNLNGFTVACLADGVGGANSGKFVSNLCVNKYLESISDFDDELIPIIESIHKSVLQYQLDLEEYRGMATTFTGCLISENKLKGVHLGDSRLCLLRGNGIKQLTINHTEANRLFLAGKLTKDELINYPRKNIIESAIGIKGQLKIQSFEFDLQFNDRIIISSDGVHELINKFEFRDLSIKYKVLKDFGDALISLLHEKVMIDNSTFLIIELSKEK